MKFYAEPNHFVTERKLNKMTGESYNVGLLTFDENGEFETTDEKLIERLKPHFKYEEVIEEAKKRGRK